MTDNQKNLIDRALVHLLEEMAEAGQAATKVLRFGLDNFHPETKETNVESLRKELTDVMVMVTILEKLDERVQPSVPLINTAMDKKKRALGI